MRKIFLYFWVLFLFVGIPSFSYAYLISGRLLDKETGKPIANAVVGIKELDAIVYTTSRGEFSFDKVPKGYYHLVFVHPLYGRNVLKIKLKRDFYIEWRLKKKVLTSFEGLYFIKKVPERFGANSLDFKDVDILPVSYFLNDKVFALQVLPGVGIGEDFFGYNIFRGSSPLFDKVYIDGFPVDYAGNVLIRLPMEVLEQVSLYKGLYPVYYSDVIGTAIKFNSREPESNGYYGRIGLSPLVPLPYAPFIYFEAVPYKDLGIVFYGRRTWYDLVIDYLTPLFGVSEKDQEDLKENSKSLLQDYFFKIYYNLFSQHKFKIISVGSRDYADLSDFEFDLGFVLHGFEWDFLVNNSLYLETKVSYYAITQRFQGEVSEISGEPVGIDISPYQYRFFQLATFAYPLNFLTLVLKGGYEVVVHKDGVHGNFNLFSFDLDIAEKAGAEVPADFPIEGTSYSVFLEPQILYNRLTATLGVKYEYYAPLSNRDISGRLQIGYKIKDHSLVYAGYGVYYKHPDPYYFLMVPYPDYKDEKASQWILGAKTKPLRKNKLSIFGQIELFYIDYSNLIVIRNPEEMEAEVDIMRVIREGKEYVLTLFKPFTDVGYGVTKGFETFLKARYGFLQVWLSYTYQVSKRSNPSLGLYDYYSYFDQTHIFRLVFIVNFYNKKYITFVWSYYTPLPYTPYIGSEYSSDDGEYLPITGDFNSGRFKGHTKLDFKYTVFSNDGRGKFYIQFSILRTSYTFKDIWDLIFKGDDSKEFQTTNYLYQSFDENDGTWESVSEPIPFLVTLGWEVSF